MASSAFEEGEYRIHPMRSVDLREIHFAYDRLTEEGKRFFHPGFLGSEPLTLRGIAGRLLLRMSARPVGGRVLRSIRLSPSLIGAVARHASMVCGFAFVLVPTIFRRRPGTFGVFVLPACEGRGVGGRLTASVLRAAKAMGLKEIELTVQTENVRAQHLYERNGFAI